MDSHFREHPEDSTVLRFLDGELTEHEATTLRSHVDGCWQCRRSLGEWQNTIDAYLRIRDAVEFAAAPPPPNPWLPFDQLIPVDKPAAQRTEARSIRFSFRRARRLLGAVLTHNDDVSSWRLWKFAPFVAGFVVVMIAGVLVFSPAPSRPPASEPSPPVSPGPATPGQGTGPETRAIPAVPPPATDHGPSSDRTSSPFHAQVLAAQVLHALGADLGEPVEILHSSTSAIVRATGLGESRRRAIQEALSQIPGVVFENVEAKPAGSPPMAAAPAHAPTPMPAPRPKLYEAEILLRLGGPTAMESFANAVLDDSDGAAARAHAIQVLTALFPADTQPLSKPDRAIVDAIAADHKAVMRRHVRSLTARLEPFLKANALPAPQTAATLAARAIELDRLLNAAFAGAQVAYTDNELDARIQFLLKELGQQ